MEQWPSGGSSQGHQALRCMAELASISCELEFFLQTAQSACCPKSILRHTQAEEPLFVCSRVTLPVDVSAGTGSRRDA